MINKVHFVTDKFTIFVKLMYFLDHLEFIAESGKLGFAFSGTRDIKKIM
jgi:hypothetical protein